jgi:hypothetical protein
MKDLICITAHCPTTEKRKILLDLVLSLQPIRKDFDLMVISHTPLTFDVQENVDWVIFDRENELLKKWEHQNQPWFSPHEGKHIQSIFFGAGNTYLTLHRQLITGYIHAKGFNYKKTHFIEYDAYFEDYTEFYDNSKILDEYDAVLYTKKDELFEINLQFGIGNFHSVKIDSLPNRAFNFNRDEILKEIEESEERTTEKRTQVLYSENGNKVKFKDHNLITKNGNILRIIDFHKGEFEMQWAVPYYDHKTDSIDFVVWNEASDKPCDIVIIINDNEIIKYEQLKKFEWSTRTLGNIEDIKNIKVIINDKLKNSITLNDENIEMFKKTNFVRYDK